MLAGSDLSVGGAVDPRSAPGAGGLDEDVSAIGEDDMLSDLRRIPVGGHQAPHPQAGQTRVGSAARRGLFDPSVPAVSRWIRKLFAERRIVHPGYRKDARRVEIAQDLRG